MRVAAEQDVFACDRAYLVANLQSRFAGEAVRRYIRNFRAQALDAIEVECGEGEYGKEEVNRRSGKGNKKALPGFFGLEGAVFFGCVNGFVATFAQHLYKAAERDGREGVERAVFFAAPAEERFAEAEREADDFDVAAACDPEVSPFVDGDEDADGDDKAEYSPKRG